MPASATCPTALIVAAAGRSSRFHQSVRLAHDQPSSTPSPALPSSRAPETAKKVFLELAGTPVWLRSLRAFAHRTDIVERWLVLSEEDVDWFESHYGSVLDAEGTRIVVGGEQRADSVRNALARVGPEVQLVAVHDAARPLISADVIDRVFARAAELGGAIAAEPITATLKRADAQGLITETVPRESLFAAQTPQVFRRDWLKQAYAEGRVDQPTDEAQLIASSGFPVALVAGSPMNLKITTASDWQVAETWLRGMAPSSS